MKTKNPIEILTRQGNVRMFKCFSNDDQVVKEIQKFKTQCRGKYPLLHIAIAEKHTELAELLLSPSFQVPINAKDFYGNTALHLAVENKNFDLFVYLINAGANVSLTNSSGNNIMHLICAPVGKNMEKFFQFLKENISVSLFKKLAHAHARNLEKEHDESEHESEHESENESCGNKLTPLHYAVKNNNFMMVESILSISSSSSSSSSSSFSFMDVIFYAKTIKMIKILETHFNTKMEDVVFDEKTGDTYLHWLFGKSFKFGITDRVFLQKVISYIGKRGNLSEFLNKKNKKGNTAVYLAFFKGFVMAATNLIELGADPRIDNCLQLVIGEHNQSMMNFLLMHGCSASIQDVVYFSKYMHVGNVDSLMPMFKKLFHSTSLEDRPTVIESIVSSTKLIVLAEYLLTSETSIITPAMLIGHVRSDNHTLFEFLVNKLIQKECEEKKEKEKRKREREEQDNVLITLDEDDDYDDDDSRYKEKFVSVIVEICKVECDFMLEIIGKYMSLSYFIKPQVIDAILTCNSAHFVSIFIIKYLLDQDIFDILTIKNRVPKRFRFAFLSAEVNQIKRRKRNRQVEDENENENEVENDGEDDDDGEDKKKECPICLEKKPNTDFIEMYCNPIHSFCEECVLKMIESKSFKCPYCRETFY